MRRNAGREISRQRAMREFAMSGVRLARSLRWRSLRCPRQHTNRPVRCTVVWVEAVAGQHFRIVSSQRRRRDRGRSGHVVISSAHRCAIANAAHVLRPKRRFSEDPRTIGEFWAQPACNRPQSRAKVNRTTSSSTSLKKAPGLIACWRCSAGLWPWCSRRLVSGNLHCNRLTASCTT